MAKFYLHMEPGTQLGKITKLKYIDDISDDELILYVFEDDSKCDESYIAEINNMEAFKGNFIMAELSDPINKWSFQTKIINLNETRKVVADDGIEYELPAPGIGINGEHISMGFTEDGTPITKSGITNGKRTDATPPRFVKNIRVEPKENYLLSLHPELLTGAKPKSSDNVTLVTKLTNTENTPVVKQVENNVTNKPKDIIPNINVNKDTVKNVALGSPISTNIIETVKHANININLDDIISRQEFDSVNITFEGKTVNMNIYDFAARLTGSETSPVVSPYTDPDYKEDILITNMIDKSKKKVYTIGIDVEMELPPQEVYETIKNVYPDGMAEHFVTSISRRMDNKSLKEALATGLTAYYESVKNNATENS